MNDHLRDRSSSSATKDVDANADEAVKPPDDKSGSAAADKMKAAR